MKKEYIIPECNVHKIELNLSILATSLAVDNTNDDDEYFYGEVNKTELWNEVW